MQLQGVPFDTLVAHPDLLPPERARFFFVDFNWVQALLDGAMSVGAHSSKSVGFHDTVRATISAATRKATVEHRARLRGVTPPPVEHVLWTGLLLRSTLVSDWPGLQVHAYADTSRVNRLATLRMERLAPTVLLCLFQGVPKLVDIEEPMEGIEFGPPDDAPPASRRIPVDTSLEPAEFARQKLLKHPVRQPFNDASEGK
jgi:hypothetical protein